MKKMHQSLTITLTLALTFSLLPSTAFAGTCVNPQPAAATAITDINSYLNDNDASGASYINAWMKTNMEKIHETYSDAYLVEFGFNWNSGSSNDHYFQWFSPSDESKIFNFGTDAALSEISPDGPPPYGIYRVPMRMRDLTKAMLNDEKLLPLLDSLFDNCSAVDASFKLRKNDENRLIWYVTLTDSIKNTGYIVKVWAEKRQDPVFSVQVLK